MLVLILGTVYIQWKFVPEQVVEERRVKETCRESKQRETDEYSPGFTVTMRKILHGLHIYSEFNMYQNYVLLLIKHHHLYD